MHRRQGHYHAKRQHGAPAINGHKAGVYDGVAAVMDAASERPTATGENRTEPRHIGNT
jgi:hypothetical protein